MILKLNKTHIETTKKLLSYLCRDYPMQIVIVIICIIISSIVNVIGSLFIQTLIDDYIAPLLLQSSPVFTELLKVLLIMGLIYLVGIITCLIYNRIMVSVSQGTMKNIRDDLFTHMQTLSIPYFDTHQHGDIMSIYTNDIDTLRQLLSQSITQLMNSFITIIAVFIAMIIISIPLTILVVLCLVCIYFISKKIATKSSKYFLLQQNSLGTINSYIEEMIHGQKVVKVFNHEKQVAKEFDSLNQTLFENADSANRYSNSLMPIMMNAGNIQYVLIAIVGGLMAISGVGSLTIGAIASFLQLSKSFSQPISQISQQLNSIIMGLAGADRIFHMMSESSEEDFGDVTLVYAIQENGKFKECDTGNIRCWKSLNADGTYTYQPVQGNVSFQHVNFAYEEDHLILSDISLYAKPNQKIALVGATGAGKTTITNLVNRFYEIKSGLIDYDGIDIKRIKKGDLRRALGIVLQDTSLFSGTLKENIRYGRPEASDDEVYAAAKLVNADDFIKRLPKGYETDLIGAGTELSQGQRQLISIARAAIANPPVMILDEATSSIDTRSEIIVQQGMDSLMKNRTVFAIAHRLSTVQNANAIIVLDHGSIIERGDHDELIKEKGIYYRLFTGLFELS